MVGSFCTDENDDPKSNDNGASRSSSMLSQMTLSAPPHPRHCFWGKTKTMATLHSLQLHRCTNSIPTLHPWWPRGWGISLDLLCKGGTECKKSAQDMHWPFGHGAGFQSRNDRGGNGQTRGKAGPEGSLLHDTSQPPQYGPSWAIHVSLG